jgi:hypothetical protein
MQQALNLQIDDIRILVDICNLEDVLLVPRRLDAKILVALTDQGFELALKSEEFGGNAPNLLVPERRRIAVEKFDLLGGGEGVEMTLVWKP